MSLRFSKMHGLGNDVVVFDARRAGRRPGPQRIAELGDRRRGIGFDQWMQLERPRQSGSLASYRVFNSDGSPAGQCGNGARCLAAWLARAGELGDGPAWLDGPGRRIELRRRGAYWSVDMGRPDFRPQALPLQAEHAPARDEAGRPLAISTVSMGNPHALIEVAAVELAPVDTLGARLERHPMFPEGCNIGFVQWIDAGRLRLRVWERGAGETQACGSAACAAVAVMQRAGRCAARVEIELPGGRLEIERDLETGRLWMTGPAAFVYEGELPDD